MLEEERPVELRHLYLVGDRDSEREHLVPTLVDGRPNPEASRFDNEPDRGGAGARGGGRAGASAATGGGCSRPGAPT